jgi:DisA bacterial checkpoint controller nucleotide-binding
MARTINLFMWAYQDTYRIRLRSFAKRTLEQFAPDLQPDVLLVGALAPDTGHDYPVCIEPEDEDWDVAVFEGLEERIRALDADHPNHNVVYGDEASNRERPSQIRSSAVRSAVLERVHAQDEARGRISFAGSSVRVGNYDVVPVLLLDRWRFASYPTLTRTQVGQFSVTRSLLEGTVSEILGQARRELGMPHSVESRRESFSVNPKELVRNAGRSLMYTPHAAADPTPFGGLFEAMNIVASLPYESAEGRGRIIVARQDHPALEKHVVFQTAVPLREPAWARKVLEMASEDVALLCDGSELLGLGHARATYDPAGEDLFEVMFRGDQTWDLVHAGQTLMRTRYGLPGLPKPRLDHAAFDDTFSRLFERHPRRDSQAIWDAVMAACQQKHGTMIVVVEDAAEESTRLSRQATPITPCRLSDKIIRRVTAIDGAVLLDPASTCHAIGVILDGLATPDGTPARGARYNSALRYVATRKDLPTLAVIVSEDGYVTMHPTLRPRVRQSDVAAVLARVEELVKEPDEKGIHSVREKLLAYRFYFDAAACERINRAMAAYKRVYMAARRVWIVDRPFEPDPRMNASYWFPEA